jgi:hypothetical protein
LGRDNYSFQKYQKELARKKKAEEKKQKKLNKKAMENVPLADLPDGSRDGHNQVTGDNPSL